MSPLCCAQLLSLEGSSVEEMLCVGHQMGRLMVLPLSTNITLAQLTSALCSTNDTQALATSFLSHLNLTPLMTLVCTVRVFVCVCVCLPSWDLQGLG